MRAFTVVLLPDSPFIPARCGAVRNSMRQAILGVLLACCTSCASVDRTMDPADDRLMAQLVEYESLATESRLLLAPQSEPGQRLLVLGRLICRENGQALPHESIQLFQADQKGSYDESVAGVEATARLNGMVKTDALGRFFVSTVLPGDYGSTADNRHIHTAVPTAQPEAYDFYFKQHINRGLLAWARQTDQAVVLDLKRGPADTLLAVGELVVRGHPAGGLN